MFLRRFNFRTLSLKPVQSGTIQQNVYNFSVFDRDSEAMRQMMEREIRSTLARLERLIAVAPAEDQRVKKAVVDHSDLTDKFQNIVFDESVP